MSGNHPSAVKVSNSKFSQAYIFMAKRSGSGIGRLYRAFGWSMAGLGATFKHEAAFRQELALCLVMTPFAFYFGSTGVERALLLGSLLLILIVELLNSAVEAAVDRISEEDHELSRRAKDIGSAAVFLSLVNAAVIWLLVIFT
jgi:diacylglycerol kinase (ATP)